jgi:hypothetical protein
MTEMKPFKDLTREDQHDLLDAWRDGELELYYCEGDWRKTEIINTNCIMRRRPKPLTKPSIDVSHVSDEWTWLARDGNGSVWLYKGLPERMSPYWAGEISQDAEVFASLDPGTCDWKHSLVDLDAIRKERGLL